MKKIITLTLICISVLRLEAQCPNPVHPDYEALMTLYNATDGPNWTDNSGWIDAAAGTNCDPCDGWYGVSCQGTDRVVNILLHENNLVGYIPSEL